WKAYFGNEADSEYPFIPDVNINASKLFKQVPKVFNLGNIRLDIYTYLHGIIRIRVYKKSNEWDLICEEIKKTIYDKNIKIDMCKIFKSDIAIVTDIGVFIFHLNTNDQLILDHFQHIIWHVNKKYGIIETLLRRYLFGTDDKELKFPVDGWISYVKNDKENFLKHGVRLLRFIIKNNDLKLMDNIYKKCLNYFKDDLENNKPFLSIITTNMPLLSKYYPEYITRYSLDTNMIIDSPDYKIEYIITSQLFPFSENLKIVNLTRSLIWTKNIYQMAKFFDSNININIARLMIVGLSLYAYKLTRKFVKKVKKGYLYCNYYVGSNLLRDLNILTNDCCACTSIYLKSSPIKE
ncbi:8531_t:CDS:2, partial [Funneliformis mosseae]